MPPVNGDIRISTKEHFVDVNIGNTNVVKRLMAQRCLSRTLQPNDNLSQGAIHFQFTNFLAPTVFVKRQRIPFFLLVSNNSGKIHNFTKLFDEYYSEVHSEQSLKHFLNHLQYTANIIILFATHCKSSNM